LPTLTVFFGLFFSAADFPNVGVRRSEIADDTSYDYFHNSQIVDDKSTSKGLFSDCLTGVVTLIVSDKEILAKEYSWKPRPCPSYSFLSNSPISEKLRPFDVRQLGQYIYNMQIVGWFTIGM
jgi:hypothetical protein